MTKRFVLIGGGHTSGSCARTLRRKGFEGDIVIVGEEPHAPYQRPLLSKELLQGEVDQDEIWSYDLSWYEEAGVELVTGVRATEIDRDSLTVSLEDGRQIGSDAVLIATGGRARRWPGLDSERVLYLRDLSDSQRLRDYTGPGKHLIIIGAGFIGSEVAASARVLGTDVTMLEALPSPLERVLGPELGTVIGAIHRDQGVDLRCGVGVESIEETSAGVLVRTADGDAIEGDAVVVGIGIEPNVEIAKASEITVGNGIRVDEFSRTSAEGIYAAGDVANHYHPVFDRRMRVEHFDNATRQGASAAVNMLAFIGLGQRQRFVDPHWFWSDQYDHNFQYAGHAENWDEVVIRGSLEDRDFVAFFMKDGKIDGAFGLDRGAEIMVAKTLISDRKEIDPAVLADDDFELMELTLPPEEDEAADVGAGTAAETIGDYKRAARSGQVPEGIIRRFMVDDTEIAIARSQGEVFAVDNYCTHLACHLSSGKVEDGGIVCLCHGSIFDLATGEPINPPATRPVKTHKAKEEDGHIYVALE